MATEEITISELELADEVLADMTLPVDTATETRAVTLKQLRAWLGSALPVGSVFASVGRLDDERFTLLDGKTISRIGTYEAFCNKVVEKVQAGTWKACTEEEFNLEVSETGQCGKFVVSNDYVRIPKLGNSLCSGVIDGMIPVVGNGMTLGLSSGTGILYGLGERVNTTGVMSCTSGTYGQPIGTTSSGTEQPNDNKSYGITTDPTKSGIEGKINSVEVFYYMVISTEGQTANVEIDINKVYEDMNLKANSDLSNVASVSSSFKEQSVGWGMPKYSWGYTIPTTDGYTGTLPEDTQINITTNQNVFSDISFIILDDNDNEISRLTANSHKGGVYEAPCEVSVIANFAKGTKFKIRSVINSGDTTLPKILAFPLKGAN